MLKDNVDKTRESQCMISHSRKDNSYILPQKNGELRCIPVALFWFIVNHLVLHLFFATVYNFSSNWLCCSEMLLYSTCVYNWSRLIAVCINLIHGFFLFFCFLFQGSLYKTIVVSKLFQQIQSLSNHWIYKVMLHLPLPVIISFEYRIIISQSLSLFKHLQVNLFHIQLNL